ncbi:MAG: hypothetical protein DWQ36_05555 [Acidobacteria bacterium]|nr:MAG: hypothetical protein DWQ36_05555 [Acidobacteriota bacterium]
MRAGGRHGGRRTGRGADCGPLSRRSEEGDAVSTRQDPDDVVGGREELGDSAAAPAPASWGRQARRQIEALFEPVPIDSLAFARGYFGLVMAVDCVIYLGMLLEMRFADPVFHFKFPYFEWVATAPYEVMRIIFWVLLPCALLIAIGRWVRPAAAVFALLWTYVLLADRAFFNNHDYLISLIALLFAVVPSSRRTGGGFRSTVPAWALRLLQFQLAIPYVYGAIAKINYDWLVRFEPMKSWLQSGRAEGGLFFSWYGTAWAPAMFSWGGFLLDLLVVPALLYRRTRIAAFLVVVGFHLFNSQLFSIGIFPWLMIGATTIFFDPTWPRRIGWRPDAVGPAARTAKKKASRRVAARQVIGDEPSQPQRAGTRLTLRQRWIATALAVWCAVQLLVPLRHFLYPGWVDWTEGGALFAWRMKIHDKVGRLDFVLVDPVSGDFQPVRDIDALLTPLQRRVMLHDPEMARQFAVYLRQRLAQAGITDREVRVVSSISLNGRPQQQMISPTVDLARLAPRTPRLQWMVPLQPLPLD